MDDIAAKHLGPSGVRSEQRGQHPDEGRLPRAVRSQQPKDRGLLDIEVDPSKRRGRPKALDHTLDVDSRIRHHSLSEMMRADRGNCATIGSGSSTGG